MGDAIEPGGNCSLPPKPRSRNNHMGTDVTEGKLSDSCRLDWLSVSYSPATNGELEQCLAYFFQASKYFAPGSSFGEGAGRRFFSESLHNRDAGILLRWTPHGGKINAGKVSIDLQGSFFQYTDADDRKALYLDISELPGWSKATRVDCQATRLEPSVNSEELYQLVRDRRTWLSGYNAYSQLAAVDAKGDAVTGASTCWGKPTAAVRCLSYNKALEQGIKDCDAIRHEVRCRKLTAEGYFDDLLSLLRQEADESNSDAEQIFVRSVLETHMNYLDTTRLAHIKDKADWPKNWAKNSNRAPFMDEFLEGPTQEVKRAFRVGQRLTDSVNACAKQYGPTVSLWVEYLVEEHGMSYEDAQDAFFAKCNAHLRDHHVDRLEELLPNVKKGALRETLEERRQSGARWTEHLTEIEP